jgi:3-hydroxybutyryl-CoA dehydrogenase
MPFESVGVIGAGVMGAGLSQALAQADHRVILVDVSEEILDRARQEIAQGVRFQVLFGKGTPAAASSDATLTRITFTTDLGALDGADFLIENVTEKWEVKRKIYPEIDRRCPRAVAIGANTSAIPITRLASLTRRPERVVGMHFMTPVPLKPTVEVIPARQTSPETLEAAKALVAALGKEAIVVRDSPGFVSNRVLMLAINEAVFLLEEQVATAEQVDRIFKTCFGHKMGPLETADLIGLDTVLYSIEVLYDAFQSEKYRPCPLLREMVGAGLRGRKSGEGFYRYDIPRTSERRSTA